MTEHSPTDPAVGQLEKLEEVLTAVRFGGLGAADPARAVLHRWFGVELNNGVWDTIASEVVGEDSPVEAREDLLYAAYASAYHWRQAGTVANQARGEHLIARAAVLVGLPARSLEHARRCLELVEGNPADMEDWDLAFALEALARAEAASGRVEAARQTLLKAETAAGAVVDDDDREVVAAELQRGPWFGLR